MKYKLVIFDMDGTILDTLDDLADSLNTALSMQGFPARTIDEVRSFVGNGIVKLLERGAPDNITEEQFEKLRADHMVYYKAHCADKTKPYDGILDLLKKLRENGCLTAVVSNKDDYAVKQLSEQYFPSLFDISIGASDDIKKKPAPDTVLKVLDELNISADDSVYIGDSEVDVETAKNSKMDCISVNWGFRSTETLINAGAKTIVSDTAQLLDILMENRS